MKRRSLLISFFSLIGLSTLYKWKYLARTSMKESIKSITPIGMHWPTKDPFLFCAHHLDKYPKANGNLGLGPEYFKDRNMGQDFQNKDGFNFYHGSEVPGFPVHPHRGFETITVVTKGYVDHADSLGAAGRYGEGDVQWMTAGAGVQHSEMFPLLNQDSENALEIFQIWLNLPAKKKMVPADFKMLWSENIPIVQTQNKSTVKVISGKYKDQRYFEAPINSWASDKENAVNIYLIDIEAGGEFALSKADKEKSRMLYFYDGSDISIGDEVITQNSAIELKADSDLIVESKQGAKLVLMQAQPIKEPVEQYGPFVMNNRAEIATAFDDYQKTQFGGWSWERKDMIHGDKKERFAKYPSGIVEKPV